MQKLNLAESTTFLLFEILFCASFIAMCEVPNWKIGPRNVDFCSSRWMFAAGVFFPSAVSNTVSGIRKRS
jgi:hypothetical protein